MEQMTDRELLELAAKAAGVVGADDGAYSDLGILIPSPRNTPANSRYLVWNPLGSDGDALRLACKLRLDMFWTPSAECVTAESTIEDISAVSQEYEEYQNGERYSGFRAQALRRAIVRAAAAIGQSMP